MSPLLERPSGIIVSFPLPSCPSRHVVETARVSDAPVVCAREFRLLKQISDRLPHHLAVHIGDGCRQRNVFRADLYTVLRVAALVNSPVAHHRPEACTPQVSSGRVQIEQAYLVDDRRTHKSRWFRKLRADFHAETAGHIETGDMPAPELPDRCVALGRGHKFRPWEPMPESA